MSNQKTRRNRKKRGLAPNAPTKRVKWHTSTESHYRLPSKEPDSMRCKHITRPEKPIVHSMGVFNNYVLTHNVFESTVRKIRMSFEHITGSCVGCIALRLQYVEKGPFVAVRCMSCECKE